MAGNEAPGVARFVVTFVDRGPPCRVLRSAVHVPTGSPGPHPLLLAVHGRDGDPADLRPLLDTWTRAGYVVVAPYLPIPDKDADDIPTPDAVADQTAIMRFVLDRVLDADTEPANPLHGLIDPSKVGAAGMSLGGMVTYGLVSNTCCRDPRIRAAILMAAVRRAFPHGKYVPQKVPVMLVQGDADPGYHNSVTAYPQLASPKWFITLRGSQHSPPFETPRGPEAPLVDAATTAFWNRYLGGDTAAADQIVGAVDASNGKATLQRG